MKHRFYLVTYKVHDLTTLYREDYREGEMIDTLPLQLYDGKEWHHSKNTIEHLKQDAKTTPNVYAIRQISRAEALTMVM